MILAPMAKALSSLTRLGMVSMVKRTSPWLGAILCNWLVCNLPRSPIAVRQTISCCGIYVTSSFKHENNPFQIYVYTMENN